MACEKCAQFGGHWRKSEKGGMVRCGCAAGVALAQVDQDRADGTVYPPVVSEDAAIVGMEMLSGLLRYVPAAGSLARTAAATEMRAMCRTQGDMVWLIQRMGKLFTEWPGTRAMRAVYCTKARPLDGFEVEAVLESYPDGIPSETLSLPPGANEIPKRISAPEEISAAASLRETVGTLAVAKSLNVIGKMRQQIRDIPIRQAGAITQADIDAAVQKSREAIARRELGL